MKLLGFIAIALAFAVVFIAVIYVLLDRMNELKSKRCGNCGMYDNPPRTCWFRFERRCPMDKACDNFYFTNELDTKDNEENT